MDKKFLVSLIIILNAVLFISVGGVNAAICPDHNSRLTCGAGTSVCGSGGTVCSRNTDIETASSRCNATTEQFDCNSCSCVCIAGLARCDGVCGVPEPRNCSLGQTYTECGGCQGDAAVILNPSSVTFPAGQGGYLSVVGTNATETATLPRGSLLFNSEIGKLRIKTAAPGSLGWQDVGASYDSGANITIANNKVSVVGTPIFSRLTVVDNYGQTQLSPQGGGFYLDYTKNEGAALAILSQNNPAKLWTGLRLDRWQATAGRAVEKWFFGMDSMLDALVVRSDSNKNVLSVFNTGLDVNGDLTTKGFSASGPGLSSFAAGINVEGVVNGSQARALFGGSGYNLSRLYSALVDIGAEYSSMSASQSLLRLSVYSGGVRTDKFKINKDGGVDAYGDINTHQRLTASGDLEVGGVIRTGSSDPKIQITSVSGGLKMAELANEDFNEYAEGLILFSARQGSNTTCTTVCSRHGLNCSFVLGVTSSDTFSDTDRTVRWRTCGENETSRTRMCFCGG